jgi:hypothetical protein
MSGVQQFEHDGFNSPKEVEVAQRKAAQHTPGPWTTWTPGLGPPRVYTTRKTELIATPAYRRNLDEEEANARLIAAAPELLEALKGLDEAYCRAGQPLTKDERYEDRKRLIAARAAIAKAEAASLSTPKEP